jgi:hypothetical protein
MDNSQLAGNAENTGKLHHDTAEKVGSVSQAQVSPDRGLKERPALDAHLQSASQLDLGTLIPVVGSFGFATIGWP